MQLTTNKNDKERKLKPWGKRLAELIMDMDLTERKFAKELGYKHPSIIYAAEKVRPISRELMGKIKEFVRKKTGKDINPEWLLTGKEPKFLANKSFERPADMALEPEKKYNQKLCSSCEEKDFIIHKYEALIKQQRELIDSLTRQIESLQKIR